MARAALHALDLALGWAIAHFGFVCMMVWVLACVFYDEFSSP